MPRMARVKTYDAIFHVMARSISEVDLFKDEEDKKTYLLFVRKYQKLYKFRVYGYCLMDNHVHLMIDVNGSDISKVMHGINFSYAQYYNRRHKRHGHLFQDRFKSKIVKDDRYLISLSAYIHNNPMDIPKYNTCPEKYCFSSLAVYLGLRQDSFELSDDIVENVLYAGKIHDVGKIDIHEEILNKPGKLTNEEYELVKKHPKSGYDIIMQTMGNETLAKIILQHHERLDGSGYPNNLTDNDISIEAKIIAVSDSFDAMTSNRPYSKAMLIEDAIAELKKHINTWYDAKVVAILEDIIEINKCHNIQFKEQCR